MDLTLVLVFVFVFLISVFILNKPKNLPPGPFSIPYLGSIFLMLRLPTKRPHLVLHDEVKKYGDVMSFWLGSDLIVVLGGYDVVHEALVKKADVFSDRKTELPNLKLLFQDSKDGNGRGVLFNNYGHSWRMLRRFALQALRDFGVGKSSLEEKIFTEIGAVSKELDHSNGSPVDIGLCMQKLVGNIIYGIIFGKRYDYDDPEFTTVMRLTNIALSGSGPVSLDNFLPPVLIKLINKRDAQVTTSREAGFRKMREYVIAQIEDHESTFDADNIRDFTDIYIQSVNDPNEDSKNKFTKEDMFRLILDLFLAGSETTSRNLDWIFLFMIEYPDVQRKCQDEITKVFGDKPVLYADRNKLPYVQATIMEIQRHANIVPMNVTHCTMEDTTIKGYHIPKRTLIFPMIYSVSHDPRYWTDSFKFKPERFLDESGKLMKKEAFIPFSEGPRVCLGEPLAKMELFLVTATLLQQFDFRRENDSFRHSFMSQDNMITNSPLPYKLRVNKRC